MIPTANDLLLIQIIEKTKIPYASYHKCKEWFKNLSPRDNEPTPPRYYHNIDHLVEVWCSIPYHEAIDATFVLYHDFIYYEKVLYPGENENASIKAFPNINNLPECDVNLIYEGILATANHTEDQPHLLGRIKGWLDGDLRGLASEWYQYNLNSEHIRMEYGFSATDKIWINGRIKFLESMLARKQIYYLQDNEKYETIARYNLAMELYNLKNLKETYHA